MKTPWMSGWLSAANQAGGAAKGNMMAEMQRQQMQAVQKMCFPWMKSGKWMDFTEYYRPVVNAHLK